MGLRCPRAGAVHVGVELLERAPLRSVCCRGAWDLGYHANRKLLSFARKLVLVSKASPARQELERHCAIIVCNTYLNGNVFVRLLVCVCVCSLARALSLCVFCCRLFVALMCGRADAGALRRLGSSCSFSVPWARPPPNPRCGVAR